jgi:hypothetical protein
VPKHYTAELTTETAEAVAANTEHVVTGFYFYKFLDGIQVTDKLIPIKVKLTGDFAKKQNVEGKVITIRKNGFFDEEDKRLDDIFTINLVLGETLFRFGVRFKWQVTPESFKMFVN